MGKKFIDGMESHIELDGMTARHYDRLMDLVSFGAYPRFIRSAMRTVAPGSGDRLLDLGCGTGRNLELLSDLAGNSGEYFGLDIGDDMLRQARHRFRNRQNVTLARGSILEDYPFEGEFDHITVSFVLHGFSHQQRMDIVRLAASRLRRGGIFSFLDWSPMDIDQSPAWFRIFFRYVECPIAYEYISHDYAHEFEELGFRLESVHPRIRGMARVVRLEKK